MSRVKITANRAPPEEDLRATYRAPFKILSANEGLRYQNLKTHATFKSMLYLDDECMEWFGFKETIDGYLKTFGMEKFAKLRFSVDVAQVVEFLSTLRFRKTKTGDKFYFRNHGVEHKFTKTSLSKWFGIPVGGATMPDNYDYSVPWKRISGLDAFVSRNSSNKLIIDNCLLYFHKYLNGALFGRVETSKISGHDLFVLECALNGTKIDTIGYMLDVLKKLMPCTNYSIPYTNVISGIIQGVKKELVAYQLEDHSNVPKLDISSLRNSQLVTKNRQFRSYASRTKSLYLGKGLACEEGGPSSVPTNEGPEIEEDHVEAEGAIPAIQEPVALSDYQRLMNQIMANHEVTQAQYLEVREDNRRTHDMLGTMQTSIERIDNEQREFKARFYEYLNYDLTLSPDQSPPTI